MLKVPIIKMATGGNVPELGGYDYQFIRKVPEDWECPVAYSGYLTGVQAECGDIYYAFHSVTLYFRKPFNLQFV